MQGIEGFFSKLKEEEGARYLEKLVAYHCVLVIKKLRPAVILSFKREHPFVKNWELHKEEIARKFDLRFEVLASTPSRVCIFFYDAMSLEQHLNQKQTHALLEAFGYKNKTIQQGIEQLRHRFSSCPCPHEIGLFLGYPAADVEAYLKNGGKGCHLCGYWKVYQDVETRRAQFQQFDHTRAAMAQLLLKGIECSEALQMI